MGAGAVTVNDMQFMRSIGDGSLGAAYQKNARYLGYLIMFGLGLLILSGLYFMYSRPALWGSEKMQAKLAIIVLLTVNGLAMNRRLLPQLSRLTAEDWSSKSSRMRQFVSAGLPWGIMSTVSWYAALVLGAAGRQPWGRWEILAVYALGLAAAYGAGSLMVKRIFDKKMAGNKLR